MMNQAIYDIDGALGPEHADTYRCNQHKDLKADDLLANLLFNDSDWKSNNEIIALLTLIESTQRKPHGHFVRLRRIKAPRQMPFSL